jgi:hypothetical protein
MYKVVREDNLEALEKAVDDLFKQNYVCVGGLAVLHIIDQVVYYFQAMEKIT